MTLRQHWGPERSMDDTHRLILQRYRRRLADDIIITEGFLAQLEEEGIFERGMVNVIKAAKTESEQIYKLLELLPKRGPEAFHKFVSVLEDDYFWLADQLTRAEPARCRSHNESVAAEASQHGEMPRERLTCDTDIKKLVGTFVHKQFGQSKRINEKDKKMVEKFLTEQIQTERDRYQAILRSATPASVDMSCEDGDDEVFRNTEIQEHLVRMYIKINIHLNADDLHEGKILPEDLSFDLVVEKLDKLSEKIRKLESQTAKCLGYFENSPQDASLPQLVAEMHATNVRNQMELKFKKDRMEKLLEEVQRFADDINRLEKERDGLRRQLMILRQEMSRHQHDMTEKISQLEKINRQLVEEKMSAVASQTARNSVFQEPVIDVSPRRRKTNYRKQSQVRNAPKKRGKPGFNI